MSVSWDERGFIDCRIRRTEPFTKEESRSLGERFLGMTPQGEPIRVLVRVESGGLPDGMDWRLEWMAFVAKHRARLRVALRRPGYATAGVDRWASMVGVELRDFGTDEDAVAWLLE